MRSNVSKWLANVHRQEIRNTSQVTLMTKKTLNAEHWAAFFSRVMLGIIFLMAGWFKCFEMGPLQHADQLFVQPFADSWIPAWLLLATGVAVPIVELVAGLLLVLGWRTQDCLVALGFILLLVTYGHLLQEPLYSIQGHILPRTVLLVSTFLLPRDVFAVDSWLRRG